MVEIAKVSGHHKALSVTYIPVTALKPATRNARTHSPEQIKQLQRSINEFGWTNPILVDETSGIVAGHGRLQAAIGLGMDQVPTIIAAKMTGRACHAIELSPTYVDVAVLRWQAFAGGVATLDGDGRTFEQVASARAEVADAAD